MYERKEYYDGVLDAHYGKRMAFGEGKMSAANFDLNNNNYYNKSIDRWHGKIYERNVPK
jgi:hypothetical protein